MQPRPLSPWRRPHSAPHVAHGTHIFAPSAIVAASRCGADVVLPCMATLHHLISISSHLHLFHSALTYSRHSPQAARSSGWDPCW
jgi:hypothetical protein